MNGSLRLKLANNPDVKGGAIEVDVKDGVVTLHGKVRTDRAKHKAETVAGKVKGVTAVERQQMFSAQGNGDFRDDMKGAT